MTEEDVQLNRRILIIDDNQAIHDDFRKILSGGAQNDELAAVQEILFGDVQDTQASGAFEVECVDQGQIGFALVQKAIREHCPFAMAFVDMRMPPGWDGIETIEHLWKVDPDLQVVICTAYSDHQWDQVMQRLGHSEKLLILRKPFDMIEVQQLADSLTSKWNFARQARQRSESLVQAEKALRHALAETESLVSAISSILIGLDNQHCIIRWNTTAEQTFGISAATILGHSIQATGIQWDWDFLMQAVQGCYEQQQPLRIPELRYLDRSGTERILGMTMSPIRGETDARSGILILGKDITQQKGFEAQLALAQKMESIGQLAAGVAHEINTPVHYVAENIRFLKESFHDLRRLLDAYDDLLHQTQNGCVSHQAIDVIADVTKEIDLEYLCQEIPTVLTQSLEGTDRVAEIVHAMKEFSHPGTGEKVSVDLNHSLQSAVTLSSKEWKGVAEVVTDFAHDLPAVRCMPTQLTQVWINLLVNAAQAIEEVISKDSLEKGIIAISTRQDIDWVEIRFFDSGPGIPESIHSQVFDLFFTTKGVGKGTGQGLALAHSIIVQNHGGQLTFESLPTGGATFIVRLPLLLHGVEKVGAKR